MDKSKPTRQLGDRSDLPIDVDRYLFDSVDIAPEALEQECIRVSADLAYWNERYAIAHKDFLLAKLDLERTESRLNIEHREILSAGAAKGPTVDAVRAAVVGDRAYVDAQLALINAEVERVRLRGVSFAIEAKKDMLQGLGATERTLMHDPLMRTQAANARAARADQQG